MKTVTIITGRLKGDDRGHRLERKVYSGLGGSVDIHVLEDLQPGRVGARRRFCNDQYWLIV